MAPTIICPNCHHPCVGLFSNEDFGVLHCGCFYDDSASEVDFHVSTEERSEYVRAIDAPAPGSPKERWLAQRCLEHLSKDWLEVVQGLLEASELGVGHIITKAYVARLHQLVTASYGPLDLRSLLLSLERMSSK